MRMLLVLFIAFTCFFQNGFSQKKPAHIPKIEPCNCAVKVDSNYSHQCGYLVVPRNVQYTKSDLLNIVVNAFYDQARIKDIPYLITQLIQGNHQPYIKEVIDNIFNGGNGPSGMRISVYCADHTILKNGTGMCQTWDETLKARDELYKACVNHVCSISKVYPLTHGSHMVDTTFTHVLSNGPCSLFRKK